MVNLTIAFGYKISFMAAQRNKMHLIKNTKKEFHIKFDSMCVMISTVRVPVRIKLLHFLSPSTFQMSKCAGKVNKYNGIVVNYMPKNICNSISTGKMK